MKRIMILILICIGVFWGGRIISINRTPPMSTYYEIGDTLDCGALTLRFVESYLEDSKEFNNRFGIDYAPLDDEYKMISICIEVTNTSDDDIGWSEIFGFLEFGFECPVWASSVDPMVGTSINRFNGDYLAPGESQRIWFSTELQRVCFKDLSWEKVDNYQYSYVLTLTPHKIAVRLDV